MNPDDYIELDSVGELPATLGGNRWGTGGLTQKAFKARLDAYCAKKGIEKLALGGRSMAASGRWKTRCRTVQNNDPWRQL